MCRVLGVSRAGFYAWERRAPSDRDLADAWLTEKIREIHTASKGTYGARRVHADLRLAHGVEVNHKRVERLMASNGLSGLPGRRRRRTTIRVEGVRVAPDLLERDFNPTAPNRTWSADITYIRTWEGWLYLAHVQDLFSRRIVGWAMTDHLRAELVKARCRWRSGGANPPRGDPSFRPGVPIHGCPLHRPLQAGRHHPSNRSKGDCFDNAVSESFHASLKKELIYRHAWPTRAEARTAVFEYIEGWFNPRRRHSTLGYLSPADYEHQHEHQP